MFTLGWLDKCAPTLNASLSSPETTLNTPFGKTSLSKAPILRPVKGVKGDGLWTNVLPIARAGAHLLTLQKTGKFHGVIPQTTPQGRRYTFVVSFTISGSKLISSATFLKRPIAHDTSPVLPATGSGFPCSFTRRQPSSSIFSSSL